MKKTNLAKKIAATTMFAAIAGAMLLGGTSALKAAWAQVPCTHFIQVHAYDVIYDAFGNPVTVPCVHTRRAHAYDVVYY